MAVILENITDPIILQDVTPPLAYLTAIEFRTLAAGMMAVTGIAALLAMDDYTLDTVLWTASMDIDAAMRYQGEKYAANQPLEFPRRPYGSNPIVWDWDDNAGRAVFPFNVKLACANQAAWLQQPKFAKRMEDIRSGLASQSIGTASESYVKAADIVAGGFTGLGDRTMRLMERYLLTTGRLL